MIIKDENIFIDILINGKKFSKLNALYENPESHEYELAWYHSSLEEPLDENEEKKRITCYIPSTNN